jgi:site-specific recombinase XerD
MTQLTTGNVSQAILVLPGEGSDHLRAWLDAYFELEDTTAESSRKVKRRDVELFLRFMEREEGMLERIRWTPRLTKAFLDRIQAEVKEGTGQRVRGNRTINRIIAHLKTWAKWIHHLRPFPLGNPTAKVKSLHLVNLLEVERALTPSEARRMLDASDMLLEIGGRSQDRKRYKNLRQRPVRKNFRPYRNRAIISLLIGSGMRVGGLCNLDLSGIDFAKKQATTIEKGNKQHT